MATTDPLKHAQAELAEAQAERDALQEDLTALEQTLEAHNGDLTLARRRREPPSKLTTIAERASALRMLVKDQRKDLVDAEARLTAARYEAQRLEEIDQLRQAAAEIPKRQAAIVDAVMKLLKSVAAPAAAIQKDADTWGDLYERFTRGIATLAAHEAERTGQPAPTYGQALADPKAWASARAQLEAAGVDVSAFDTHPIGETWYSVKRSQSMAPASGPTHLRIPVPADLAAGIFTEEDRLQGGAFHAFQWLDTPDMARRVIQAVFWGELDAKAKPTNAQAQDSAAA